MALTAVLIAPMHADGPGRIYTKTNPTDTGRITGEVTGTTLTHAIAVERDRTRVYLATLDQSARKFDFNHLPVGRFDLLLVTQDGRLVEGLALGAVSNLPAPRARHLAEAVAKADSFFNRHVCHRSGIKGETALVLTERIRDQQILRGSGEPLNANLRRLEIIELQQADDDWQMTRTRHLYREETPRQDNTPFLVLTQLPSLSGVRITTTTRDLGNLDLTKSSTP